MGACLTIFDFENPGDFYSTRRITKLRNGSVANFADPCCYESPQQTEPSKLHTKKDPGYMSPSEVFEKYGRR
jgi:hypothetical protein